MSDQPTLRVRGSAQGGRVAFEDGPSAVRVGGDGLYACTFLAGPLTGGEVGTDDRVTECQLWAAGPSPPVGIRQSPPRKTANALVRCLKLQVKGMKRAAWLA